MRGIHFVLSFFVLFTAVFASPLGSNVRGDATAMSTVEKRDLSTIWSALNKITEDLTTMNKTLEDFNGETIKAVPILDAATMTLKDIMSGIDRVKATEELNLITSALVLVPVYYLYYAVDGVTSQLVTKKDMFEKADVGFVVADELAQFQKAGSEMITQTVGKIPSWLGIISNPIGYSIKNLIDNAAKSYGIAIP